MKNIYSLLRIHPLLLSICTIICFTSCDKLILRITGNYRTPRGQDQSSVIHYLKDRNALYDQAYVFKSKREYQLFFHENPSLPGNYIFNSEKKLLHPSNGSDCPWFTLWSLIDTSSVIQSVKLLPDTTNSCKQTLSYFLDKCKPIDIKNISEQYDYYFICTWAFFTPKFTRDSFKELYRFKNNPNKKICVILVNADYQKNWE